MSTPSLDEVRVEAGQYVRAIHDMFTPDSKILVVVVFPHRPAQNWMLGDATIDEAIEGLRYLAQEGTECR